MRSKILAGAMVALYLAAAAPSTANEQLRMCLPGERNTATKTCVVDGDTLWLHGENIRLESFDTPEPQTNLCGGDFERELAHQASARLLELMNGNDWTIERFGYDPNGRRLATIRIHGIDVGDVLIAERLARSWPEGAEWWCR
jgi:endonuclease YncB( thermonuclease family)